MAVLREIVIHCRQAASLAGFWAEVLDGYQVRPYDEAEIERLASFGRTPETDRLVGHGASVAREFDTWTILHDPEGNEFCVTDAR